MTYSLRLSSPQRCTSIAGRRCSSSLCCFAAAILLLASASAQAGTTLNAVERPSLDLSPVETHAPSVDPSRAKENSWTEYWKDDSAQESAEVPEPAFKPESLKASRTFDHGAPVLIPTPTALWTGTIGLVGVGLMTQLRRVRRWFV